MKFHKHRDNRDDEDESLDVFDGELGLKDLPVEDDSPRHHKKGRPKLTAVGNSMRKLLRSPGSIRKKMRSKRNLNSTSGTGSVRMSKIRASELMNDPKAFSKLSPEEKEKLEQMVAEELGIEEL